MYFSGVADIKCPYYHSQQKKTITCEGIVGEETMNRFENEDDKRIQLNLCCNHYPNDCEIYKMNEKKYI